MIYKHISKTAMESADEAMDSLGQEFVGEKKDLVAASTGLMAVAILIGLTAHLNERLDKLETMISDR